MKIKHHMYHSVFVIDSWLFSDAFALLNMQMATLRFTACDNSSTVFSRANAYRHSSIIHCLSLYLPGVLGAYHV